MRKVNEYKTELLKLQNWDEYLLHESGLPGPRANLELLDAVIDVGTEDIFNKYASIHNLAEASVNSPEVFLVCCGVAGFGKLVSLGDTSYFTKLHRFASDKRWRVREAVAIGLQRVGVSDMNLLLKEMKNWSEGNWLEKRAVVAALCEPKLLKDKNIAAKVLEILNGITKTILHLENRKEEDFQTLRKTLGYGWSVAVVAYPELGKDLMETWLNSKDKDIIWIMKENLKKNRLQRMDNSWTSHLINC